MHKHMQVYTTYREVSMHMCAHTCMHVCVEAEVNLVCCSSGAIHIGF